MADVELIVASIFVSFFFLLFALLFYQSIKKQRKAYSLTISLFLGGIAGILSIFDVLREQLGIQHRYFLYYSLIIASFCYFLIYLFFEQLIEPKPNRIRLVIASILLFSSVVFNQLFFYFSDLFGVEGTPLRILELLWDFSYDIFGLFIFVFGAYIHFKSYNINKELVSLIQAISLIFISIGFIFGLLVDIEALAIPKIGDIIKIVGLIAFTAVYVIRIDYIYRLPVNVFFILSFSNTGLNIHISRIHTQGDDTNPDSRGEEYNEKLLSGVIVAISNLLQESLGSKKKLERIVSGDRSIILDSGSLATCAILCDKSTHFLKNSLGTLRKMVEKKYRDELKKPVIFKGDFQEMDQLISKTFPFLVIEKA